MLTNKLITDKKLSEMVQLLYCSNNYTKLNNGNDINKANARS